MIARTYLARIFLAISLLCALPAIAEPLHEAVQKGTVSEVKRLIAKGADVHAKDEKGNTPLHFAAFKGDAVVAELLIENGAKVNARNRLRVTPLHVAAYAGNTMVAELLIKNGAKVSAQDKRGNTPLADAAKTGHATVAELLIKNGAEVNARSRLGITPLHLAAAYGHAPVAKLLINKGAEVNARSKHGSTALHLAANYGHVPVAELLIRKGGAEVQARAENGDTPLDLASLGGHKSMVALLKKHGAKEQRGQAQKVPGCRLSDLSIDVNVPEGYTRFPTECPRVDYTRDLNPTQTLAFYIVETPAPYPSAKKITPSEFIDTQIAATQMVFDRAYKGQSYNFSRIDESADYPPSLVDHGGACGGVIARTPTEGRAGVEWRRGIICLVELPPTGSDKWRLIQAFFSDMNFDPDDYKPVADFEQAARELFRSIRLKGAS